MNQLIIKLKGEIQSSNFSEWKDELITQIQSVNNQLITDDDFVVALRYVDLFKNAEKYLKEAKQSAIEQSHDIQKLFSAIDEISEKARQTRLSLEHQIKARKSEIKEECIQTGIKIVKDFIDKQIIDFQVIDHATYLDRARFESIIKRKKDINGIKSVIDYLCKEIKNEISKKSDEVKNNAIKIDMLTNKYKVLFQDRSFLLSLSMQELNLTIDKRISLFNEVNERTKAEKAIDTLNKLEDSDLNIEIQENQEKQKYRIILDILSSKDIAIEIARAIRSAYGDNSSILSIKLNRNHD